MIKCNIVEHAKSLLICISNRKKYAEKFYRIFKDHDLKNNIVQPWAFLACVLNENFKELKTHAAVNSPNPYLLTWTPDLHHCKPFQSTSEVED